jgi:ribonuclease P protein component
VSETAPAGRLSGDERLSARERLRRRTDYLRCYRTGGRRHSALAILYFAPNGLDHPRLGITASRKVAGAVGRRRLRRHVKEIYRRWSGRTRLPAVDLVVHLKPAAAKAGFQALRQDLLALMRRLHRVDPAGG